MRFDKDVRPLIGLQISGAILADQVKSLDWQARQVGSVALWHR